MLSAVNKVIQCASIGDVGVSPAVNADAKPFFPLGRRE